MKDYTEQQLSELERSSITVDSDTGIIVAHRGGDSITDQDVIDWIKEQLARNYLEMQQSPGLLGAIYRRMKREEKKPPASDGQGQG